MPQHNPPDESAISGASPAVKVPAIDFESERAAARRVALIGWPLLIAYIAVLVAVAVWQPDPYAMGWVLVLGNLFIGRAFNITLGLQQGYDTLYLLFQCGLEDIILLMVIYPYLVVGYEHASRWKYVGPFFRDIRRSAERHRRRVDWLGPLGLVLFVFFPFWSTGPLVGGVLGYLMGLRPFMLLASVFLGNTLSVIIGLYFFETVHRISEPLGTWLPAIIFGLVAAILVAGYVTARRKTVGGESIS